MNKPISVGDVAVVVRWPHPCRSHNIGKIFRVEYINPRGVRCGNCGEELLTAHGPSAQTSDGRGAPLSWCKRIPPLDELDDVKHDEEITA